MIISVCMGIYNGEKYIEQQLISLLEQTRAVDEVILCDDGSEDNTVDIVERFIRDNKREGCWKLYQNLERKGYPANFYYAMSLCAGDVVFLADQDDVWSVNKISKMCDVFAGHPEVKSVCCKFGLIDAKGQKIRSIMTPTWSRESGQIRNVTIDDVFYKCEWPGMVMAYRREWYEQKIIKWNREGSKLYEMNIPHDFLVAAWAAEDKGFFQLDVELAWHRRHENNTGEEEQRITKLINKERKVKEIKTYLQYLELFKTYNVLQTECGKIALNHKYFMMKGRLEVLLSGRIWLSIKNVWKNRKGTRFVTAICDILIIIKDRKKE